MQCSRNLLAFELSIQNVLEEASGFSIGARCSWPLDFCIWRGFRNQDPRDIRTEDLFEFAVFWVGDPPRLKTPLSTNFFIRIR